MANLSPFQRGSGSLQLFSVYQEVPQGDKNDAKLTGLRRDEYTARAPGVFKESAIEDTDDDSALLEDSLIGGTRLPGDLVMIARQMCR
jgi:hypothetical protein